MAPQRARIRNPSRTMGEGESKGGRFSKDGEWNNAQGTREEGRKRVDFQSECSEEEKAFPEQEDCINLN